jgi:hypothetical protein
VVVRAELEQARVKVDSAALPREHGCLQVVVEQDARTAREVLEAGHVAREEVLLTLVEEEFQIERAREAQRHHEARQLPLGAAHQHLAEVRPVHLRLLAGQRDQPQKRLLRRRTQPRHHRAQPLDRAQITALADHLQKSRRTQTRILLQRLAQKRQVGIQPARAQPPRAVQRVRLDRGAHRVAVHAQLGGDRADLPVFGVVQPADRGELLRIQHLLTPRMGRSARRRCRRSDTRPRSRSERAAAGSAHAG